MTTEADTPADGGDLVGRTAIAFIDQALKSAAGFLVAVVLIKFTSKQEYGYYAIAFPVSLFLIALQNAVVTTPMTVLLAAKNGPDKRRYVRALCWGQLAGIVPVATVALLVVTVAGALGLDMARVGIVAALCASSAGVLLLQFLRAYDFAEERPGAVLRADLVQLGVFAALLALAVRIGAASSATTFLFSGLSCMAAFMLLRRRDLDPVWETADLRAAYAENWQHGRWALLGVVAVHIQTYSSTYMLGAMAGSLAVADLSAARLLLMPFMLIRQGWAQVSVPHGARLRQDGRMRVYVRGLIGACVTGPAMIVAYAAVLCHLAPLLERILFTDKFDRAFDLVPLWAAVAAAQFIRMNASFGLQVLTQFRLLAMVNTAMMVVTVIAGYVLIRLTGIPGALTAMLLGEGAMAVLLWAALIYHTYINPPPEDARA